jgi:hypothetical protein
MKSRPLRSASAQCPAPLKVLVVRMSSFGDIVHTVPAIVVLRRHFPDAVVDWLVQDGYDRLVMWVEGLRRVWTLPGPVLRRHASVQRVFSEAADGLMRLRLISPDGKPMAWRRRCGRRRSRFPANPVGAFPGPRRRAGPGYRVPGT